MVELGLKKVRMRFGGGKAEATGHERFTANMTKTYMTKSKWGEAAQS